MVAQFVRDMDLVPEKAIRDGKDEEARRHLDESIRLDTQIARQVKASEGAESVVVSLKDKRLSLGPDCEKPRLGHPA